MPAIARNRGRGFTLTELAVVFAIASLLLATGLYTLAAQTDQRNFEETRRRLEAARELLLGFAIVVGRLPCPATATSGGAEAITTPPNCDATYGGFLPARRPSKEKLAIPELATWQRLLDASGEREISTTMAFVQFLQTLLRDKTVGPRVVPIIPDEARTFGMEGMFRQLGIYSSVGQLYEPVDAGQIAPYKEAKDGQILEEGISEAGGLCSWIAAGTAW